MAQKRLPLLVERRRVGFTRNLLSGALMPVERSFLIGHGQQLARRRSAELAASNAATYAGLIERAPSRQVLRHRARAAAKLQRGRRR